MAAESSFGRWLQRRRKALDLTQEELAQRVGCATETLRKIEADARRPSRPIAERLADALELPRADRAAFVRAARAELAVDRLAPPMYGVPQVAFALAAALPRGTVTFVFTDVEGSTRLWEQHPTAMHEALTTHYDLLRQLIQAHGGVIFKTVGDGVHAAFVRAPDALAAAIAAQRALNTETWGATGPLRVRMALHTGVAQERDGDYFGTPLNRVARLLVAGHGGQILLTRATQELVCDTLPPDVTLQDLGTHRLKDLTRPEHIFQVIAPNLPNDFPRLRTLDTRPHNLPAQLTPLIGRAEEVTAVCDHLRRDGVRLVTLTGPGGTGKTRLALQTAAELIEVFVDGVFFVDLAPVTDPDLVTWTIAATLGVQETSDEPLVGRLKASLWSKHHLLVLDNFEHVVEAAPLVEELLVAAPKIKVLITSRTVLHLYGEHEVIVPPLAVPDPTRLPPLDRLSQYDAVRLFIERVQAVRADFVLTSANALAVAEICIRLDGLPLAIELAAARSKLFSPDALLARLSSRLQMLTGGARTLPPRQQTLRNTIDWSYHLLNQSEQRLFQRLSVFVGGCTWEVAEAVCNADGDLALQVLDGLASLVDKSLLRRDEGPDGEPRFTMLETIREYARERLVEHGEITALRRQHALYYVVLAEIAESKLRGPGQLLWLNRLEQEHDNLRTALAWALEQESGEWAGRLVSALWLFWWERGYLSEGRHWLDIALERSSSLTISIRAKALVGAGFLTGEQGEYEQAQTLLSQSLALSRELHDIEGTAQCLKYLGRVALYIGDYTKAGQLLQESLYIARRVNNKQLTADVLNHLGLVALYQADYDNVRLFCQESLTLFRELDDKHGIALCLHNLGWAWLNQGDYERGIALCEESLALCRAMRRTPRIAGLLIDLGYAALYQRAYTRAATLCIEALLLYRTLGNKEGIAFCLEAMAGIAAMRGAAARAVQLFGSAEALRDTTHAPLPPLYRAYHDHSIAVAAAALDGPTFATTWAAGRALSLEQAIHFALEGDILHVEHTASRSILSAF